MTDDIDDLISQREETLRKMRARMIKMGSGTQERARAASIIKNFELDLEQLKKMKSNT